MTAIRRLAAILAADVAGYSRLMGADEESASCLYVAIRHHAKRQRVASGFCFTLSRIIRYNAPPTAFSG
jgi:acetoin utilization deacetylase AcuC-like enzyme